MKTASDKTTRRIDFFKADLGQTKAIKDKFANLYEEHKGDWGKISGILEDDSDFKPGMIHKLQFTNDLASWSNDNEAVVTRFQKDKKINSMRDLAWTYNKEALAQTLETANAATSEISHEAMAETLHTNLFHLQPTASMYRILNDPTESPVADKTISGNMAIFLKNQPATFNIKTTSVYNAFTDENAFNDIPVSSRDALISNLKSIQRVVALSPVPEVMPALFKTNMTSAYRISEMSKKQFVTSFSSEFGKDGVSIAKQLHTNAVNARIRNEQALISMKEAGQGSGVDFIDKSLQIRSNTDIKSIGAMATAAYGVDEVVHETLQKNNLSWDTLFGDADFCECGECNSVYSAAAYFVDLLQYLRNNTIDPNASGINAIKTDPKDISDTPLEKLFDRRPDLGCLQLTCKNTNTILPYIDLVNEVMENYIVYHHTKPFNVTDQTSGELLAQPQNTEYEAYCILHKAVYPFTLPYHQPIDVARTYLDHLESSRHELIHTFRSVRKGKTEPVPEEDAVDESNGETFTEAENLELDKLHTAYIDRAADAECLGLTQEEYVILTKEAFVSKTYWDKQCKTEHTLEEYHDKIGLKPVHEYYGYNSEAEMQDTEEATKSGLTFVKDQFLRRTGVSYVDLVELLKTQCLNPNVPIGRARTLMNSIGFSYRYLQSLVDQTASTPKAKYEKVVDFLNKYQPLLPLLDALLNPDPCNTKAIDLCTETKDLEKWVYCYFEQIGKIIVLENGVSCIDGVFYLNAKLSEKYSKIPVATVVNCQIIFRDENGNEKVVGNIDKTTGLITFIDENTENEGDWSLIIFISSEGEAGQIIQYNDKPYLVNARTGLPFAMSQTDSCNLDTVRLVHLDGSTVTTEEYDKIQRFIRLWRKMGWTIDEIDKALIGLSSKKDECIDDLLPDDTDCEADCDDLFEDSEDCENADVNGDCFGPKNSMNICCEITPAFLHEMAAVKKLLKSTGLELIKLLTFWSPISTSGEHSLYKRLFLKHNLKGIDKIFVANKNGDYLTKNTKISEHEPVVMAAFNLSSEYIRAILEYESLEDNLTIENLSVFYRYRLLSRVIGLKIPDFISVLPLFGNPFKDAHTTRKFIKNWTKMEDAGFDYRQLNYSIRGYNDQKKPLAPTREDILLLAKSLYDGLNAIDDTHKDIAEDELLTLDMVRSKAILLFPQEMVNRIAGIIEGTHMFTTNAPKDLVINMADDKTLKNKLVYGSEAGSIQITGILTLAETTEYKTLSNDPKWEEALLRIEKQQAKQFKEVLFDVFETEKQKSPEKQTEVEAAEGVMKEGDINIPFEEIPDGAEDPNTAPKKSRAFMSVFIPFLRDQLIHRFVVEILAQKIGLEEAVTDVLISEILTSGEPATPIYTIFESIKESAKPSVTDWSGYLIPSIEADHTIIIRDSDTAPVVSLDGNLLVFTQQEDPTNEWWSDPIKLKAGGLYTLLVTDKELNSVYWKTPTSSIENIPASSLLPDFTKDFTEEAFIKLGKTAILAEVFEIGAEEFQHFKKQAADFGDIDFNELHLTQWLRLEAYIRFRDSLPTTDTNIIEFFNWTHSPDDASLLSEKIATLTLWEQDRIDQLIHENHFDMDRAEAFYNEINLLKLQKALKVADKVAMNIDLLFDWAKPTSNFKKCRRIADSIQYAFRAKYEQEDWEQAVKPLNDKIRNNQEAALIAYCLQLPEIINWGVTDADGLFEYFLIDVQMDACMETSRIKQALSSVQLFVQRCFLGLEEEHNGITPDVLDRERWDFMQRYRVWEANRKVFLYPENWIESNLRDDKSSFFEELESELLQNDINTQNTLDTLKSYLYKVDEVSNMEIVGLYIEGTKSSDSWDEGSKLHVFARTRSAPYFFYYRYLSLDQMNWYPWGKMQVDIPNYDLEDSENKIIGNGCYLTPAVWNGRLMVTFPQFAKKTRPAANTGSNYNSIGNNNSPNDSQPIEYWEIKMGMSEFRKGKWTQKQLSKNAIYHDNGSNLPSIQEYEFTPMPASHSLQVKVSHNSVALPNNQRCFEFGIGGSISVLNPAPIGDNSVNVNDFHHENHNIVSLQVNNNVNEHLFNDENETTYNFNSFHIPHIHNLVGLINQPSLENFFAYNTDITGIDKEDAFGKNGDSYHELKKPYALYHWELFFHTPMMLGNATGEAQQFEEAMKLYHNVFNPMADGTDDKRFWQFAPFKDLDTQNILDAIFNNLKPNTADEAINAWRENPFMPHLVARSRPVAYMKWVVMKYIDNLIAWGDYLFRQDTIESINQASQLYVLAFHILGRRPHMIPKRGKIQPQTYNALLGKWDAFSNAMVELEIALPFSNQTSLPIGIDNGVVGMANIFGFSSTLYFCIPNNPKLMGYWDTIEDRLFKIRHCLNIQGIFRKLALFEPPIDPALLVKAAAHGLSIASVLNDLNTPMPNYRFYYLLQKSLELCTELKTMGNAMLSALEKKDNETLSLIRAKHEGVMHNLVMEIKKQQLDEAEKSLDSLYQNRKTPEQRMKYYLQLIGEDANKVPGLDTDFTALANAIAAPVEESGLKLNEHEKEDMDKASAAADWQIGIGVVETLASVFHALPTMTVDGTPLGVGATAIWGFPNLANATSAVGRGLKIYADNLSYQSTRASKKGGFLRSLQDRVHQANLAGLEIKQIDKQIVAQQIRIDMANQEISNQQQLIDNTVEVEEFIKNKYTNEELYTWMKGNLRTLYHQVYSQAYELAKKAEKVFRFERGLSSSDYIQAGYWESGRDGLLAGEQLYVGLKQLEAAHQEKRGHDYEITKHVSVRQINPLALIELKETGKCEFSFPEILFDMDYPGHYKRRIKSVSISIPCIVGPYTGLNATLRLLENKFRNSAIANNKGDYLEKTEETDDRFMTFNIPITAIAASTAQNESGVFELNFNGERYLPFEGAGAVSSWRLELPEFRQFDYDTISDAIIHLNYTSNEGGERIKKAATETVVDFNKDNEELGQHEGLFSIIDLKHDLSNEWHKAMQVEDGDTERVIAINDVVRFLPYYVRIDSEGKARGSDDIKITDVVLTTASDLQAAELVLVQGGNEVNFTDGISVGNTKTFAIRDEEIKAESLNVTIKNVDKTIDKALMVVRFILK